MVVSGIALADIARMAGVGRAAVSNWRSRYADFPQPSGGTRRNPSFDRTAVERWLHIHRRNTASQAHSVPAEVSAAPPPLAEPLLNLLRRAQRRKPGVWLLHEEIIDNGLATAPLVRQLARQGHLERHRLVLPHGNRVLLRLPHTGDNVDVRDIEQQVNAVLAAVGHRVTIHPARDTAGNYTSTKITYRGKAYTGYLRTRPWMVSVTEDASV